MEKPLAKYEGYIVEETIVKEWPLRHMFHDTRRKMNRTTSTLAFAVAITLTADAEVRPLTGNENRMNSIAESEYHIRIAQDSQTLTAPNRKQNLRATFWADGFQVLPRKPDAENNWSLKLLSQFSSQNQKSEANIERQSLSISDGSIVTQYYNRPSGLEQTFLLTKNPGTELIELAFEAQTEGLYLTISDDGQEIFFDDGFQNVLRYGDLKVFDSTQTMLEARFVQTGPGAFSIKVNAKGAVFPVLIDPTVTFIKAYSASQTSAHFGYSVAYGRLRGSNGDLVVGAPDYDNGQSNEGRVFVYHGTDTGFPSTADWTGECDQASASFGLSVHCTDINKDGYDDLCVGAPYYDVSSYTDAGEVFIWLGSGLGLGANGTPANADFTRTGTANYYQAYGYSLSSADINDDTYPDLIIGAPDSNTGQGAVYVYHGSSSGPASTPNWTASSSQTNSHFGFSVTGMADIDNSQNGAVAIGAPDYDNGQSDEGAVFIWYGSGSGLGSNGTEMNKDVFLEKNQASASFGYSLANVGDVDGSGYDSLAVGAPLYDSGQSNEGAVFVYYATSSGVPTSSNWMGEGDESGARLGLSVAGGVDLDEDGSYKDILVGMPYKDNSGTDRGAAYIWLGGASGINGGTTGNPSNASYGVTYEGSNNARAGWSVAVGASVKYYLHPGFYIGIPYADDDYSDSGEADIWYIAP